MYYVSLFVLINTHEHKCIWVYLVIKFIHPFNDIQSNSYLL